MKKEQILQCFSRINSYRFSNRKNIVYWILLLVLICMCLSIVSMYFMTGEWVGVSDDPDMGASYAIINFLFIPFLAIWFSPWSLPFSMSELFGLSKGAMLNETSLIKPCFLIDPDIIIGVYWATVVLLLVFLFWKRKKYLFAAYAVIMLISSIYWFYLTLEVMLV